jgi:pyridinium-3,5-bisthiocarboxylic acid mononucleotide nickel chelatase
VPVMMKKGRPGFVLSALARPSHEQAVAHAMLEETTALGVRVGRRRRYELEREERSIQIEGQPVRVKIGRLDGRIVNVAPEHDDCATVARQTGAPVKSVWTAALAAARELK